MPSTFLGIETTRRGLQVHQRSLETTGHNIANVNTQGYSRQQAVHSASSPYANISLMSKMTPGQLGTGVEINEIRRIRNEYLDTQARDNATSLSYWQVKEEVLVRVETVIAEPGSFGIGDSLTAFFRAWQDVNNTPEDPGVKAAVAELGDELAAMMRETYTQLDNIRTSLYETEDDGGQLIVNGGQIGDQLAVVKDILKQIQDVTKAIKKVYEHGNQPNDLLDKRDMLLDQLAQYGPVSFEHITSNGKPTGEMKLWFLGEKLDMENLNELKLIYEPGPQLVSPNDIYLFDEANPDANKITISINGVVKDLSKFTGSLAGLEVSRAEVAQYQNGLARLAEALKQTLAQIVHDVDDPLNPIEFFSGSLIKGDFRVNDAILNNPQIIDGTRAIYVARLYGKHLEADKAINLGQIYGNPPVDVEVTPESYYALGEATFHDHYNALLTTIGANYASVTDMVDNQTAINHQITSLREAVSGVNLDEELSLMIQFQYGYQASARVMTMFDELIDYLINRTA